MPSPTDKSILDGINELKAVMADCLATLKLMLVELKDDKKGK